MKTLKDYILESDNDKEENGINSEEENNDLDSTEIRQTIITPQDTTIDIGLVGEIRLYSNQSETYRVRKEAIADKFRSMNDLSMYNSDRISSSKIMEIYIDALIKGYKDFIDSDITKKINLNTKKELKRQIADDVILLIKTTKLSYNK